MPESRTVLELVVMPDGRHVIVDDPEQLAGLTEAYLGGIGAGVWRGRDGEREVFVSGAHVSRWWLREIEGSPVSSAENAGANE